MTRPGRFISSLSARKTLARGTMGAGLLLLLTFFSLPSGAAAPDAIPAPWLVLPTPRCVDYGPNDAFLPVKNVAIVRKPGGPYQTVRTPQGELEAGGSVIEEELAALLKEQGVTAQTVADTPEACAPFDTLILLGPPKHNAQTAVWFTRLGLAFTKWKDPRTPEEVFTDWPSLGPEGYVLKAAALDGKTVIILSGYDYDDARKLTRCAGTFYAFQSFRQLLVKEGDSLRVKTAEILDKPLLTVRGCYTGFDPDEKLQERCIDFIAQMKANQNIYWYGNSIGGYNGEAAARFRYPWKPEQLEVFRRMGKKCREHFITMVFCMNADHYTVDWATAKSFDGTRKDPLHYKLGHPVEPQFQEMWKKLGFDVKNDADILAAKFRQLDEAVPGAILQMMNEDDVFGLVHDEDKQFFATQTGDARQDSVNYGKARAQFLAALYKRVKELCPDYPGLMPVCPPDGVCYQFSLERNEQESQAFMQSMSATLKEQGLQDALPIITTGGGTEAEVIAAKQIDDFRGWCGGAPAVLCENSFPYGFHIGAFETDKAGPRFAWQTNKDYPSGYRDRELYKRLLGIHWNGLNDQHVLGWCEAQYLWNMLALDRAPLNALATRKVCSAESYPLVKSFYEEFDNAGCYLPDCQPPIHVLVVSDGLAFRGENVNGWQYNITYTDDRRREAQRLRAKWAALKPELEKRWDSPFEKASSFKSLGDRAHAFCNVYLAYGYLQGWEGPTPEAILEGPALRDLYLEAEEIQQRFFGGPDAIAGGTFVDRAEYTSTLHFLYTDGKMGLSPDHPSKAERYTDIWAKGLRDKFYTQAGAVTPAALPDGDAKIAGTWAKGEGTEGDRYRTVTNEATVVFEKPVDRPALLRVKLASASGALTDRTPVTLEGGGVLRSDVVCGARWITWQVSGQGPIERLSIKGEKPVRVYAVEIYKDKS
ncbi:MAG: hypothetical protein HZB26_08650 [Candidatus Hydrogenedentes bacterium]|nr:hypothetical protein [Candidatus Hydrogenedentota bacterium]